MVWPTALRAFRYRDFRLFWTGQLVSLVGSWIQSVGQAWIVLELTHSPFKLGVISALQFGPMLFLSFLAGALADRVRKRRLLLLTQSALMLQAFALATLDRTGQIQYWHVAVLATLYGIANTLDLPARQSFVVEIVGKHDLINAIALNSAVFNGARVVGPAVAALLVARYGVGIAFLLNGLSFIAVIAALLAIRTEGEPRPRSGDTLGQEILQGIRYAWETPLIALVLPLARHEPVRHQLRGARAADRARRVARRRPRLRSSHGLSWDRGGDGSRGIGPRRAWTGAGVAARGRGARRGRQRGRAGRRAPVLGSGRASRGGGIRHDRVHGQLQHDDAGDGARRTPRPPDGCVRLRLRGDDSVRRAPDRDGGRALGRAGRLRGGRGLRGRVSAGAHAVVGPPSLGSAAVGPGLSMTRRV